MCLLDSMVVLTRCWNWYTHHDPDDGVVVPMCTIGLWALGFHGDWMQLHDLLPEREALDFGF